mmetsp:Transcript_23854/g.36302  ORF Transcript_23854/g.36302 Transcript_23854/m.36302 type:complete len:301 (+) Transcript_23854:114-1016(+)
MQHEINPCALLLSELHKRVIDLLDNLTLRKASGRLSFLLLLLNLSFDPKVSLLKTIGNLNGWCPSQFLADQHIVGVTPSNSHGSINMLDGKILLLEAHGNLGELNHINHFGGSKIDRYFAVGEHEAKNTINTVINEGKGTSLLSISPHFEVFSGSDGLTAECSWGLLASSHPGSTGSVDVMETSNADLHGEVTSVGKGHLFGVKLLESVHVLGTGRPGISFDKTGVLGIFLLCFVVNTGTGRIEEVGGTSTTASFEHIHGDGGIVERKDGFVGTDESHTSHISGKVVYVFASFTSLDGYV